MEGKHFLKHFAIIGGGTVLNILVGLITTPVITRIVDPTEYGQLSIFTMYASMALMVLCMGFDQALVRYYYERDSIQYRSALLQKCLLLPLLLSTVISFLIIVLSSVGLVKFEFSTEIMVLLCLNTIFQLIFRFGQLLVRLGYKSKLFSALSVIQKTSYVVIAILLLMIFDGEDFRILAFATTVSFLLAAIMSIISQKTLWRFDKSECSHCHIPQRVLFRYAFPYVFSMGITSFFQAVDKLFLNHYCTYAEVGVYASAVTLVHIFAIVQTAFNALWAPAAVEHYTKDSEDRCFYQKANQIITVIMIFIGISLILFKDVFAFLLGEQYREAAYVLPFLIFNPIMYTISETTVNGLVFKKKSEWHILIAIGACIANILGNIILVPKLGGRGAAISNGIAYVVFFCLRTFLSNRMFYVDFHLKRFACITIAVSLYAFYNTFNQCDVLSIVGYIVCVLLLGCLYRDVIVWGLKFIKSFSFTKQKT